MLWNSRTKKRDNQQTEICAYPSLPSMVKIAMAIAGNYCKRMFHAIPILVRQRLGSLRHSTGSDQHLRHAFSEPPLRELFTACI